MFFSPRPFKKCPIGSHSVWPDWIINERFWQQVFVTKVAQKCKILGSFFEKRHFSVKTVEVTIGATFQKIGLLSISTTWSHCIHPSVHPSIHQRCPISFVKVYAKICRSGPEKNRKLFSGRNEDWARPRNWDSEAADQCDRIWRKFATLAKVYKYLAKFLTVYFLFGKMLSLLRHICDIIGLFFIVANGQILKNNLI